MILLIINHNLPEIGTQQQCNYCAHSFKDVVWDTILFGNKMYKHSNCPSCHKEILISVNNKIGSGHDNWDGKNSWHNNKAIKFPKTKNKMKTLDRRVEILSSRAFSK